MRIKIHFWSFVAALLVVMSSTAMADSFGEGASQFTIDFTPIGNAGNSADPLTGRGAVSYDYRMGTYAISQDQVNAAIAAGLENVSTDTLHDAIKLRSASTSPATLASWYEAAAFVNFLNTSKGYQAAYNLSFSSGVWTMSLWDVSQTDGVNLYRNKSAIYVLPSLDEFYKAAYYDPNKGGGGGYWLYTTGSDTAPQPVGGAGWNYGGYGTNAGTTVWNIASWSGSAATTGAGGLSPYGTMGQGGNVAQWLETAVDEINDDATENRIATGYHFASPVVDDATQLGYWSNSSPTLETDEVGFRVAAVPEPSTYALVILGGIVALFSCMKRRFGRAMPF
jgi:sulfatase modifying factor 1